MAYYVARLYTGSADGSFEDFINDVVIKDLLPSLQQSGGLHRYVTGISEDGRLVSASLYNTKEDAANGIQAARELVANIPSLRQLHLNTILQGEVADTIPGDQPDARPAHGSARVYQTRASAREVADGIRNTSPNTSVAGRVRTVFVQLEDGRVATFSSYTSKDAQAAHTNAIMRFRRESDDMKRILPNDPEEITVRVVTVNQG